jgi:mono/diheme cytochrome c family protein
MMMTRHRLNALLAIATSLLFMIGSVQVSAASKKDEQAGALLFRKKGCAYCHGAAAEGTPKGPSLANIRKTWKAPQIANQILHGGQKMPAFEESLKADEVAQLVAFLRAKQRPVVPPAQP